MQMKGFIRSMRFNLSISQRGLKGLAILFPSIVMTVGSRNYQMKRYFREGLIQHLSSVLRLVRSVCQSLLRGLCESDSRVLKGKLKFFVSLPMSPSTITRLHSHWRNQLHLFQDQPTSLMSACLFSDRCSQKQQASLSLANFLLEVMLMVTTPLSMNYHNTSSASFDSCSRGSA